MNDEIGDDRELRLLSHDDDDDATMTAVKQQEKPSTGSKSVPVAESAKSVAKTTAAATTAKKRKRATTNKTASPSKKKTKKTSSAPSKTKKAASAAAASRINKIRSTNKVPPPVRTLVVDNGGDTIKYGWNFQQEPERMSNVTARLQQQWTVLVGDQLSQIQNPNQLVGVVHSTERGVIVNLGNQIQVWKRMLDLLGVVVPTNTDTAKIFGWKTNNTARQKQQQQSPAITKILPQTCAVLLTVPPHCPRVILDQILFVWMEDFGFSHVGLCHGSLCAASAQQKQHDALHTCTLVDLGWSATHVVPCYKGQVIRPCAIRRMPLAGRHLINMWKYYTSYRQWNLMDQDWILRDVMEKTAYASLNFAHDMSEARKVPAGRRHFDCEYILPDFQNTFRGQVRMKAVQQQAEEDSDDEDDDDDEDADENEMESAGEEGGDDREEEAEEEVADDSEDEEESPAAKRRRLLKEREEAAKLRRVQEEEQQVLNVGVERFAIPESLFRPSDAGLPREWAGLAEAIVQSIQASPKEFQAALYLSIHLTGGLSKMSKIKERLERELRALTPCQYAVSVSKSESPIDQAWKGACKLSMEDPYTKWSVSKDEWEDSSKRGAWKRFCLV